jgi:hypothetical protein
MKAEDPIEARGIKMKESSQQAMDFYEGFLSAINEGAPFFNIRLQVFDATKSDSLLREVLKNDSIKHSDHYHWSGFYIRCTHCFGVLQKE